MDLVHHHRLPGPGHVSIERLFEGVRAHLPSTWRARVVRCPLISQGVLDRFINTICARFRAGSINHITGDVHYLAGFLPRKGLVLTIHDCALLKILRPPSLAIFRYFWFIMPIRRAEVVTTISATMRDEIVELTGSDPGKIRVVANGVRSEFVPTPKAFADREPTILLVGTGWNKNIEGVARALRGIPCKVEIIGSLNEKQRDLLELNDISYKALGRISDPEVLEAYKRSDFLIFASLYEGFGLPIIEAQAIGRLVITSNYGAMAEAAGEGALLVDPHDPGSIRSAVLRIIGDAHLRDSLLVKGYDNVRKYQPEAVALQYVLIYEGIALK